MFEHMRNYEELLARIAAGSAGRKALRACLRSPCLAYPFEKEGSSNWRGVISSRRFDAERGSLSVLRSEISG